MLSCVLVFVCSNQVDILLLRFGNEVAGVEDLGTTGRGGDMQVSVYCVVCVGGMMCLLGSSRAERGSCGSQ